MMENSNIKGSSVIEKLYNYLNGNHSNECHTCGNITEFKGLDSGYETYCTWKCSNSNINKKKQVIYTVKEKYGVTNISQNEETKKKVRDSIKGRFGELGLRHPEILSKKEQTCLLKYNVKYVSQDPKIYAKIQKSGFKMRSYTFPSGRVVLVRGYEGRTLDILLELGFLENDLEVRVARMPFRIFLL